MERRTNEDANMMSHLLPEAEEEDYEDDDDFESNEDGDDKDLNDDDQEGDDDEDEEENDLECYLRKRGIDETRLRARTAPLRPMENIEKFKTTPNFINLEQAAVCANQIVQRND